MEGGAARRRLPALVAGSSARRTAQADAIIAVSDGMRADVLDCYPDRRPATACTSCTTASTPTSSHPDRRDRRAGAERHRPGPPVRAVRRADHPAEGDRRTCSAPADAVRPLGAARALRVGAPDTPEIGAEVEALVAAAAGRRATASSGSTSMLAAPRRRPAAARTPRCSSARRSTSRWASSTSRRWRARPRSSPATSAASPRSWSTARPGCSCTTTRGRPRGFETSFAAAVNAVALDPARAAAMGAAGRARAVESFAWESVAEQTVAVYRSVC